MYKCRRVSKPWNITFPASLSVARATRLISGHWSRERKEPGAASGQESSDGDVMCLREKHTHTDTHRGNWPSRRSKNAVIATHRSQQDHQEVCGRLLPALLSPVSQSLLLSFQATLHLNLRLSSTSTPSQNTESYARREIWEFLLGSIGF